MMTRWIMLSLLALPALAAAAACGDDEGSGGAGGGTGGTGTGTTTTSEGGAGTGGEGTGGAACLMFAATCNTASDVCCDVAGVAGECFAFGNGPRCSIPCPADPADCPNNGAGCNNMTPAYCKAE